MSWREPDVFPNIPSTPATKLGLSIVATAIWGVRIYRRRTWSNLVGTTIMLSHGFHIVDSELTISRIPKEDRWKLYTIANTYETFFLPYDMAVTLLLYYLSNRSARDLRIAIFLLLKNLPFYLKALESDPNNPPIRLGLLDTPLKRSLFELLHATSGVLGALYFARD